MAYGEGVFKDPKYCQKCACPECNGTGWIGNADCWSCGAEEHTCVPWLGPQRFRQMKNGLEPFSRRELIEIVSRGRKDSISSDCRYLATIEELLQKYEGHGILAS